MRLFALLLFGVFTVLSHPAQAQKKVALVIGNGGYHTQSTLNGPPNDSRQLGDALRKAGFALVGNGPQVNLTKRDMDYSVGLLGRAAVGADIALFYYSGHGAQVGGTNYLMPIDESSSSRAEFMTQNVSMDMIMYQLAESKAKLKIVILDACRNNPFVRNGKAGSDGLAQMQAPEGTLIAFATQPGNTARDGNPLSPYTKVLLDFILRPGLDIFALFNDVGVNTIDYTQNAQQPWVNMSPIRGKFYFVQPNAQPVQVASVQPTFTPVALPPQTNTTPVVTGASINLTQRAYQELARKDFSSARSTLADAIAQDGRNAVPYSYRGFSHLYEGNEERKRLWPDERYGLSESTARAILEYYKRAFVDLDQAIELDSQYASARKHRGNAIVATYQVRKAAKLSVNDILDKAIIDLKIALQLDPTSLSTLISLGDAFVLKGFYSDAISQYNAVTTANPKYAAAYHGRCKAYAAQGNSFSAQSEAATAARLSDEYSKKHCLNGI